MELIKLADACGAQFGTLDSCTHYLHQGNKSVETFRDFKFAKQKRKFIVSPKWLEMVSNKFSLASICLTTAESKLVHLLGNLTYSLTKEGSP